MPSVNSEDVAEEMQANIWEFYNAQTADAEGGVSVADFMKATMAIMQKCREMAQAQ